MVDFEGDTLLQNLIKNSLAYAYEAKKDYKKAMTYFEEVASAENAVMNDVALFNLARLYGAEGNKQKSTETYKQILSDHADSIYIDIIKEKLNG